MAVATNGGPNLECRMYEAKYPEVNTAVMIQVKNVTDMGAYVSLLEYNNIEGMTLLSQLSRRPIRSICSLIKVGQQEPIMVLRVDEKKGYIGLSKRRVSEEDILVCKERYNKSKLVHSIMRHVAKTLSIDLEELYVNIGWPLYRKYGHAFEAFKVIVTDPDTVLDGLSGVTPEVKDALVKNIRRRMTPQPSKVSRSDKSKLVRSIMQHVAETLSIDLKELNVKIGCPLYRKYGHAFEAFKVIVMDPDTVLDGLNGVTPEVKDALVKNIRRRMIPQLSKIRADIEMTCFQFDGVEHIKDAIRKAEAAGREDCPVKIKLVAPPLYVLTTQTLDMEQGITVLTNAIKVCTDAIVSHQGELIVKEAPRATECRVWRIC